MLTASQPCRATERAKLEIANRLRRETVLPITALAEKLNLGSPKTRARSREQNQKLHAATSMESQEATVENVALL